MCISNVYKYIILNLYIPVKSDGEKMVFLQQLCDLCLKKFSLTAADFVV